MRIATLDLGTNTFRLLITENQDGNVKRIYRETNITRLGEGLVNSGRIKEEAIGRSLSILSKYKNIMDSYGVQKILAAGTSAFRNADNGSEFVSKIHDETGIEVMILSGNAEAEITVKGVMESIDSSVKRFYHLDIGGGSTEISLIKNGRIEFSKSIDMGVVLFAEEISAQNNRRNDLSEIVGELLVKNIGPEIKDENKNIPLVATSGTPIVIACIIEGMKEFEPSAVNNKRVELNQIEEIKEKLIKFSNCNKLEKFGNVLKGREDLIVPGALILFKTMKFLENDCMIISDSGLLDGLLYIEN